MILPKQEFDPNPDLIKDFAMLIDNDPESFKEAISNILADRDLSQKMVQRGLKIIKKINSDVMEKKEKELYLKLLK